MLSKVPENFQVRLLRPIHEENPSCFIKPNSTFEATKSTRKNKTMLKKIINSSWLSIFMGFGIYTALRIIGLELGPFESLIILLGPSIFGFVTSIIVF